MPKIINTDPDKAGILLSDIKEYIDLYYKDSMLDLLYRRAKRQEEELHEYGQEIGQLHGALDDCMAENAKLRKVADAARALVPSEMYQCTRHLYALKHTLDEYVEKEKIMDKFTPEQRADIQAMADELSKVLQSEEEWTQDD